VEESILTWVMQCMILGNSIFSNKTILVLEESTFSYKVASINCGRVHFFRGGGVCRLKCGRVHFNIHVGNAVYVKEDSNFGRVHFLLGLPA